MPAITTSAMTDQEQAQFSVAAQEILLAQADGYCRIDLRTGPGGAPRLTSENSAHGHREKALERALETTQDAIRAGKAVITQKPGRAPVLEPAMITKQHLYPMAYMTPQEESEFQAALEAVNQAVRAGQCRFESDLDQDARVYFRYSVHDNAENREEILGSIALIVQQVHAGKAVRIEMPNGGVMMMPRWPAAGAPTAGN